MADHTMVMTVVDPGRPAQMDESFHAPEVYLSRLARVETESYHGNSRCFQVGVWGQGRTMSIIDAVRPPTDGQM